MPAVSTYSPETADALCELVSSGKSLQAACQALKISRSTVRRWLVERPDFKREHEAACQMRLEVLADEVIEIVDSVAGSDSTAAVAAARNRAEARRWLLSKVAYATYGDRLTVTTPGQPGSPVDADDQFAGIINYTPPAEPPVLIETVGEAFAVLIPPTPAPRFFPGGRSGIHRALDLMPDPPSREDKK